MVHPNRPYPLYELPRIESLRHMLEMQAHDDPDRISFRFRKGKEIAEKTASGFFRDVCALGTWLLHHGIQEKHVALIDGNSYPWLVVYFAVILSGNVIVQGFWVCDLSRDEAEYIALDWSGLPDYQSRVTSMVPVHFEAACMAEKYTGTTSDGDKLTFWVPVTGANAGKVTLLTMDGDGGYDISVLLNM